MKDALDKNFKSLLRREDPMLPSGTAVSLRFEVGQAFSGMNWPRADHPSN